MRGRVSRAAVRGGVAALIVAVGTAWSCGESAGPTTTLIRDGESQAVIVRGEQDRYAASRLIENLNQLAVVPEAESLAARGEDVVILVGTLDSNGALRSAADAFGLTERIAALPPEGYLIKTHAADGRRFILAAGGDRVGAIYAASDLKSFYLQRHGRSVVVEELDILETPKMKYRWFWNWDVRTNWDLLHHDDVSHRQTLETYSVRPNYKAPDAYLTNMKMVVDYMSEHKLNGLTLWGFLRDNHGGVKASQELCRYAKERGVDIIPGVNLDRIYGGIYHEGDHEYNIETWLAKHPGLRAVDRDGNPMPDALCAQKPENREWMANAIRWLFANFEIGGVNLEFSEHDVCYTKDCIRARQEMPGDDPPFYKDLARIMPFAMGVIHETAPDAVISYATYGGFTAEMQDSRAVDLIPDYAVAQWTLTWMLHDLVRPVRQWQDRTQDWPEGLRAPTQHSIGYLHWGSIFTSQAKSFLGEAYRLANQKAARNGFEGMTTYGEESPLFPNTELNYLAYSEFAYNPDLTLDAFLDTRVAPLYGGKQAARTLWDIAKDLGDVRRGDKHPNKQPILERAYEGARSSDERGRERWSRLISFIRESL